MAKAKYVTSGSNIQELIAAVQQSSKIQEEMRQDSVSSEFILRNIANNINDAAEGIIAIKELMVGNNLKNLETQKEQNKMQDDILEALKGIKPKAEAKAEAKGDFSWLGLAGSLIAGLVAGGVSFITEYVASFAKLWSVLGDKALGMISKVLKWVDTKTGGLVTKVAEVFTKVGEFFGNIWAKTAESFKAVKTFISEGFAKSLSFIGDFFKSGIGEQIAKFFTSMKDGIKNVFRFEELGKDIANLWTDIKGIFGMMFGPDSFIGKIFSGGGGGMIDDVLKSLKSVFTFFDPLISFFKNFGAILGKLAVPLQVIMSIFDTVSGALDGWNNTQGGFMDKLFGAISGGLTGLLNGLIGGLLDLLKDGMSWILNLLGFENASKFLDSFSFEKLIEEGVGGFFNFVKGMIDWVVGVFNSGIDLAKSIGQKVLAIGDMAKDFIKSILQAVLPKPSSDMASVSYWAGKAIPDAVYEFAGMNPKTGEALAKSTAENSQAKTENAAAQADASQKPVVVAGGGGNSSSSKTSHTAVVSAKSTKFDNEDMWARGATIM